MFQTLRWRPVAPAGFPHVLTEDNVYGEYMIPKGTMLFANTWAIHRDESEYASPAEFIPERFLDNKFGSKLKAEDGDIGDDKRRITYAFGAGRRVCAGQRLAENSLVSAVSMGRAAARHSTSGFHSPDADDNHGQDRLGLRHQSVCTSRRQYRKRLYGWIRAGAKEVSRRLCATNAGTRFDCCEGGRRGREVLESFRECGLGVMRLR